MVEMAFRIALLLISTVGYLLWGSRRFSIRLEFMPAVFCACVSNALVIAGILNLLPAAECAIFAGGFALLILQLHKGLRLDGRECIFLAALLAIAFAYACFFNGARLTFIDDFGHWGLAAREALFYDRLPRELESLLTHQTYPMGSAMFIYYIGKIVNPSEGCMLWSQFLFELSLLASLLGLIENRSWSVAPVPFLFGAYALLQMMGITNLCVDTLLALVPIAGCALILGHGDRPRAATVFCALFSALAINVKSSGIFFAAVLIVICFIRFRGAFSVRQLAARCALPPLAMYVLWNRHVYYAFANAGASRHAISLAYFRGILSQKNAQVIAETVKSVLASFVFTGKGFLSEDNCLFLSLCFGLLLLSVLAIMLRAENAGGGRQSGESRLRRAAGLLTGITLAYEVCLIAFYIVSMESNGIMSSYWRYAGTCGLCVLGVAVAYALSMFNSIKTGKARGCASVALIAILCMTFYTTKDGVRLRDHRAQLYERPASYIVNGVLDRLENAGKELGVQNGEKMLAYSNGEEKPLFEETLKYAFWSGDVDCAENPDEVLAEADQYDYLFIWDASQKDLTPFLGLGEWLGEAQDIAVIKIHGGGGVYGG